jgi:hypothetical protein
MTTAFVVLLLVAALVALSIVRPGAPAEFPGAFRDRDQERQLAELRAIADHQSDHSTWKAASRFASASTSPATSPSSCWNGSQRTSPSM